MLSKLKKAQKGEGFTIIEVMIVLAIAGLILLIVFLAVPALQRNSRNTQRKSDAGRLASAVSNWVSNNNGAVPSTTANVTTIFQDAGNLGQFSALTAGTGAMAQGQIRVMAEPAGGLAAPTIAVAGAGATTDAFEILTNAQCGAGGATTNAANAHAIAVLYTIEPGAGAANYTIDCQNI